MEAVTPTITVADVLHLIEDARDAELCRNLAESQRALEPVWPDIERDPDFGHFPPAVNAELLRLAGFFLSFYGKSRNKRAFQMRGKDLLTAAIRIFEEELSHNKAAEAKVMLALCYWYSGEVADCDAILDQVEHEFAGNHLHPVYLQIRVNRLMVLFWNQKYDEAIQIVKNLALSMEVSRDARLITMYHNQAGLVYWKTCRMDKAIFHLNEAVEHATKANNQRFVGLNLNNLAMTYKCLRKFDLAHNYADEANRIFEQLQDTGWIPHVLDTKALIYLDEGLPDMALESIDSALSLFHQGEDFAGLADSLWTKCLCLLKLGRAEEAFTIYGELHCIASQNIGAAVAGQYAKAFADLAYPPKSPPSSSNAIAVPEPLRKLPTPDIAVIHFPEHYHLTFANTRKPASVQTFYCSEKMMRGFGSEEDAIVAVRPADNLAAGVILLYNRDKRYLFGRLEYEELSRLFFVEGRGINEPMLLDDVQIVGVVVGYCPAHLLEGSTALDFQPLRLEDNDGNTRTFC